jgi:predicted dehydrogenase
MGLKRGEMSKNNIRIGIVGCGSWAEEAHIPYLTSHPNVTIAGIVDAAPRIRAEKLAQKFGIPIVVNEIGALLSEVPLDAVVISTPHFLHFQHALAGLEAGLHVHVDKPLADTFSGFSQLQEVASFKNLILSIHTQKKYMPGQAPLRWYLQRYFSQIYHISGEIWQPVFSDFSNSWRADGGKSSGGILMDSGYHIIDTVVSLMNVKSLSEVKDIQTIFHNAGNTTDSFSTLLFRIGQTVVQVNAFRGAPRTLKKEEYQFLGDGGYLQLLYTSGVQKMCDLVFIDSACTKRERENIVVTSGFRSYPLQLFIEAIRGDSQAESIVKQNVLVARLCTAILESAYEKVSSLRL